MIIFTATTKMQWNSYPKNHTIIWMGIFFISVLVSIWINVKKMKENAYLHNEAFSGSIGQKKIIWGKK